MSHSQADRFIPSRPRRSLPLNITPRTIRIARVFDLLDDRVLNFADAPASMPDIKVFSLLRKSVSQLFHSPSTIHPASAIANLGTRKQFILALDGPGVPGDPFAYPLSWSLKNYIAVACGIDVYYQNLDTRAISRLCKLEQHHGLLHAIEWGGREKEHVLALGTTMGTVQLWDANVVGGTGTSSLVRSWPDLNWLGVGGMSWHKDVLAVGRSKGKLSLFDTRVKEEMKRVSGCKGKVLGVKWSPDGNYLASGDQFGVVYIWDARACKSTVDSGQRGQKIQHDAPVKVSKSRTVFQNIYQLH